MEVLKTKIKSLRRKNFSRHYFVPELRLYSVLTEDAVRSALVDWPSYRQDEVARNVVQRGRKIFGILLLSNLVAQLPKFIEVMKLDDAKLPFERTVLEDIGLLEEQATDFYDNQWEFTAPTFLRGTLNRTFEEDTVLPFIANRELDEGGFGKVCEAELDPEHQELGDVFPPKFAVKEFKIRTQSHESHKKELENLAILNHLKHPNIVELLGSYTYNGRHSLLFALADAGNLNKLLSAERNTTKFILSDFGLSTFKSPTQDSATPLTSGTDDYLAPDDPIHRASDVWSLGCILSELATYMRYGRDGLQRFRSVRKFKASSIMTLYQFHQGYGCPSEAVIDWLSNLAASGPKACALLVSLAQDMLQVDHSQRPKAKEVTRRLRLIALCEVSTTISDAFCQVKSRNQSLDMFLEQTKFNAWRYAIGIFYTENSLATLQSESSRADMSQFDSILECLYRLRKDIKSRLSRETPTQLLDLSRLLSLNDELQSFLNPEQKVLLREYFHITVLRGGGEMLKQLEHGDTSVALGHELRVRASIKHVKNLIDREPDSSSRALRLDLKNIDINSKFDNHHLGYIHDGQNSRQVWIEWRGYGHHSSDKYDLERLYGRATRVAELLSREKPTSFCALKCIGVFNDEFRTAFGVVFEVPESARRAEPLEPMSLHQVIKGPKEGSRYTPDLDDKFRLALSLAESLLELHSVQWFHKSLSAANVVFFPGAPRVTGVSILEPFLVGFDHSRPDDPSDFTSGAANNQTKNSKNYQHPEYLKKGSGYCPEYDYYGLGIILMEIGFWRDFAEIVNRPQYQGLSYEARRQELLRDRVPRLSKHMGRAYSEAVRCCIQGDFGGPLGEGVEEQNIVLRFGERVVGQLRGCSI
ncbi:kinase-like protein [Thozetella sp. PMI_491]|nr:kinase-like protein [Thozetella sp. PMI_491]